MSVFPAIGTDRGLRRRRWMGSLLAATLAAATGCGHSDSLPSYPVYEVKGQVLLANGKPLDTGRVFFVPKGDLPLTPSGAIGPDGTFSVVTGGSGEGAPAGEYKLRIEAIQYQSPRTRKPIIPPKYADEDSSGLVVSVRAEPNHLDPIRLR